MASGVTTRCAWLSQGESVTELMPFMDFLVHSYTCCSDRHASPYWTLIRRWILMGFTTSLLKQQMVHVTSRAIIFTQLRRRRVAFLHFTALVGHSSDHECHCCLLTRQSSCVSNFYHTFVVFIWISLVCMVLVAAKFLAFSYPNGCISWFTNNLTYLFVTNKQYLWEIY
jgi:hypothetical protein